MGEYYILEGHKTKKTDMETWAKGFGGNPTVAKDKIGKVKVSTIFLGLDHNWGEGEPILFETMVFGGELDEEQVRYCTWEEAEKGHKAMVELVWFSEKYMKNIFKKIPLTIAYVIAGTLLIGSIFFYVLYLLFTSDIEF